ncbi:MAG: thiamine-phosphate kinase [Saccharospirillum sp.]
MTEFELIEQCFAHWPVTHPDLRLGQGDDCLIWQSPEPLAMSIDTAVQGRHFPDWASGAQAAQRAFLPAVSDLAAMGGTPVFFTQALTLPRPLNEAWLLDYAERLKQLASDYQMALAGGDTTAGPVPVISIQVHGTAQKPLKRSTAQDGDDVWLSGHTGLAAAAIAALLQDQNAAIPQAWQDAYWQPQPRIALGQALVGKAHAAIDLSDGLWADLAHIAKASGLSIELHADHLPLHDSLAGVPQAQALKWMLTGGDDYELAFTAAQHQRDTLLGLSETLGLPLTRIGKVVAGDAAVIVRHNGKRLTLEQQGFEHF